MLKIWNVSLVLATGMLAILGTFLVRSGILDSIHAFGASTLGVPFVTLIGVMIAGSIALVVWRREALRTENRLDSLLSREAIFLANNLVLVGDGVRRLLGHVLAAHRRGADRHAARARPAVVRPVHGAAGARARPAERDRAGDRVAQGDRRRRAAQLAAARRSSASRVVREPAALGAGVARRSRWRCSSAARSSSAASGRSSGAALGVRRAMTGEGPLAALSSRSCAQPPPLRRLPRARRAWRCCSSASRRRRRSATRDDAPEARPDDAQSAATS